MITIQVDLVFNLHTIDPYWIVAHSLVKVAFKRTKSRIIELLQTGQNIIIRRFSILGNLPEAVTKVALFGFLTLRRLIS